MRFKNLAYRGVDELIFGYSKNPLRYGLNLTVGDGKVVPEVKYMLKPGFERDLNLTVEEYKKITLSIMHRALNLNLKNVQLDTELTEPMVTNPELGGEIVKTQKEILQKYHNEHHINTALRVTVADIRRFSRESRSNNYLDMIIESFKTVAESGADLLSIESRGGQEVFSYSLIRGNLPGILFSTGILAPRDVRSLWSKIVKKTYKAIPAGDSACALANSAMVLANGLKDRRIPHVLAAVIRAMSTVRTLTCYEEGAKGPGKDCAYENVIIKAITGYPISMEGKVAAIAHSSLIGNIAAATCDLWSNETVVFDDFFGGKSVAVMLEMLSYDTMLMNKSISTGNSRILQKLLVESDKYRDPQALILSPENAFRIAKAIVSVDKDYERTVSAANESIRIISENLNMLELPESERKYLTLLENFFKNVPDENVLTREFIEKYSVKIPNFNVLNYEL